MAKIFKGDVGTVIIVDTLNDLSEASVIKLKVKKPGATTVVEWTPVEVVETTKLQYVIVADDLDKVGVYSLQAYVELPAWSGHGEVATFQVYDLWTT